MRSDPPFATDEALRVLVAQYQGTHPGLTASQVRESARLGDLETDLALLELEEQGDVRRHALDMSYVATYRGLRRDQARRAKQRAS